MIFRLKGPFASIQIGVLSCCLPLVPVHLLRLLLIHFLTIHISNCHFDDSFCRQPLFHPCTSKYHTHFYEPLSDIHASFSSSTVPLQLILSHVPPCPLHGAFPPVCTPSTSLLSTPSHERIPGSAIARPRAGSRSDVRYLLFVIVQGCSIFAGYD